MSLSDFKLIEEENPVCRRCGSTDIKNDGYPQLRSSNELVQHYKCNKCGATLTAGVHHVPRVRVPRDQIDAMLHHLREGERVADIARDFYEKTGVAVSKTSLYQWRKKFDPDAVRPRTRVIRIRQWRVYAPRQLSLWDFPDDFRVHLTEEARRRTLRLLSKNGYFKSNLYKMLRKTTHRGRKKGVWPGSVNLENLRLIGKVIHRTKPRLERDVVRVFRLTADNSISGPFPRTLDGDYAWLAGLFFSCGTIVERDRMTSAQSRERLVIYRVDKTVVGELLRVAERAGLSKPTVSSYIEYQTKRFERARVLMPHPLYDVLIALGLPHTVKAGRRGGGRHVASRERWLAVPTFVKHGRAEVRRRFVEGYMNGSKLQTWNYEKLERRENSPISTSLIRTNPYGADIRFLAPTEWQCRVFADFVIQVLNDHGIAGNLRRLRIGHAQFHLAYCITGRAVGTLLTSFRLHRENVARLAGRSGSDVMLPLPAYHW